MIRYALAAAIAAALPAVAEPPKPTETEKTTDDKTRQKAVDHSEAESQSGRTSGVSGLDLGSTRVKETAKADRGTGGVSGVSGLDLGSSRATDTSSKASEDKPEGAAPGK